MKETLQSIHFSQTNIENDSISKILNYFPNLKSIDLSHSDIVDEVFTAPPSNRKVCDDNQGTQAP
jgi:hypothetical protein